VIDGRRLFVRVDVSFRFVSFRFVSADLVVPFAFPVGMRQIDSSGRGELGDQKNRVSVRVSSYGFETKKAEDQ
jgi:hypothetical protein